MFSVADHFTGGAFVPGATALWFGPRHHGQSSAKETVAVSRNRASHRVIMGCHVKQFHGICNRRLFAPVVAGKQLIRD
jgi:hypothetical protein